MEKHKLLSLTLSISSKEVNKGKSFSMQNEGINFYKLRNKRLRIF